MISDIDLRDWERTDENVRLYEVERNSIVSVAGDNDWVVLFDHIDGAYSYCLDLLSGDVVHLAAYTDVNVWNKKNA
jgi:hypothetical protein